MIPSKFKHQWYNLPLVVTDPSKLLYAIYKIFKDGMAADDSRIRASKLFQLKPRTFSLVKLFEPIPRKHIKSIL